MKKLQIYYLEADMFPILDEHLEYVRPLAHLDGEELIPVRLQRVGYVGRLQQRHIAQRHRHKRIRLVVAVNVEEGVVGVRQVPGLDNVHLEGAMQEGDVFLAFQHCTCLYQVTKVCKQTVQRGEGGGLYSVHSGVMYSVAPCRLLGRHWGRGKTSI